MITKYFSSVVVKFNPTIKSARTARMFLSALPPKRRGEITVKQTILDTNSSDKPEITVKYKDGKTISVDPTSVGTTLDMVQKFDQYSRSLKIQDDISDA